MAKKVLVKINFSAPFQTTYPSPKKGLSQSSEFKFQYVNLQKNSPNGFYFTPLSKKKPKQKTPPP
ncbi:hypothetical protein KCA24_29265, partial [Escherichia coli]|nr:hypothetical protein [Escherichia coli]